MSQPIYNNITNDDWDSVRNATRRANERLSELEGYGGITKKASNTNMDGNKIIKGPYRMHYADSNEFITRDYLRSREGAQLISNALKTGGSAPLNLSESTPGAGTLYGGGDYVPPDLIYPGDDLATMTDFTVESRMWKPIYPIANDGTFHMTWNDDGSFYTYCDRMYNSATMDIYQIWMGSLSRFRMYPNESGVLRFRVDMPYIAWTLGSYISDRTWGVGMISDNVRFPTWVFNGPGWGQWRFSGDYTGPGFGHTSGQYSSWDFFPDSNQVNYPLGIHVIIDWEIRWSEVGTTPGMWRTDKCWWHIPGGAPFAYWTESNIIDNNRMKDGMTVFIGYTCAAGGWPVIAQFSEFQLIEGVMSVGYV